MPRLTRPGVLLLVLTLVLTVSACSSKSIGCPVAAASCPCIGACVAPSYVFASAPATLAAFPVKANGELGAPVNMPAAAIFSFRLAASQLGGVLYQPDVASRSVLAYTINPGTGGLTSVPGSPFAMGTGSGGALDIAISPDGQKLFVSDFNGSIVTFRIAGSGALTLLTSSPLLLEGLPHSLALDVTGKFLYSTDPNDLVLGYAVNSNGSLSALPGLPVVLPLASHPEGVATDVSGKFLYVTLAGANSVAAFSIDPTTGVLTAVGTPIAAGSQPETITVNSSGFVYAINAKNNNISAYKINSTDGSLQPVAGSPFPTGAPANPSLLIPFPGSIAVDHAGRSLWVGAPSSSSVSAFAIDGMTGALTFLGVTSFPATTPPGQVGVAFYQP